MWGSENRIQSLRLAYPNLISHIKLGPQVLYPQRWGEAEVTLYFPTPWALQGKVAMALGRVGGRKQSSSKKLKLQVQGDPGTDFFKKVI